jgi:hypothetical protein
MVGGASPVAKAMAFTKARTKREAIVTALMDFNCRRRMVALVARATLAPRG